MQTTKLLFSLTISLMLAFSANAHEVLSDWKLARESEGIMISYRNLKVGDTLKTRQMRISFLVESVPDEIIPMFKNADKLTLWSAGTKKCEILQNDSSTWTTYNLLDIPWPFQQKDLITEYKMEMANSSIKLNMISKPNQLPHYEDISRMEKYQGQWIFTPIGNGQTKVELTTIAFSKSPVPRFIMDPILQDIFIDSMNTLKVLLAEEESKRILAFE